MYSGRSRLASVRWENVFLVFGGLVIAVCLVLLPDTPGPRPLETPEALLPMGIGAGLCLFTLRIRRRNYGPDQRMRIARDGWIGALVAASISGWWVAVHLQSGAPLGGLTDQILTVLSGGLGAGVLSGQAAISTRPATAAPGTERVLAETSWTNRAGSEPVLEAIVEAVADVEGVAPTELDPLYEHVDPEILAELRTQDAARWRFLLYTDEYEIGVSSAGAVTVYDASVAVGGAGRITPE